MSKLIDLVLEMQLLSHIRIAPLLPWCHLFALLHNVKRPQPQYSSWHRDVVECLVLVPNKPWHYSFMLATLA